MAMELTNTQLQQLKSALRERRTGLLESIRRQLLDADKPSYTELAGAVHDLEDESVATLLEDLDHSQLSHHVEEVHEIEAALQRVAEGNYGYCVDCGQEIEYRRLLAQPTARRCLDDQAKHERTFRGAERPTL
ncbi:MAG TPA: TraR/DksA family transcriptional regulator [Gammaproteobacteria bacterium]|nr:TraR/DksA family transcriptional regulator [Gammaproteobacteria bacterium]